jgi:hypothetical protein
MSRRDWGGRYYAHCGDVALVTHVIGSDQDRALNLFSAGLFEESLQYFTNPAFRCAAAFNSGDRALLLREPVSYERELSLAMVRGSSWLNYKILSEGLASEFPVAKDIFERIKPKAKGAGPRKLGEMLLIPGLAQGPDAPQNVRHFVQIHRLLVHKNFELADVELQNALAIMGPRPVLGLYRYIILAAAAPDRSMDFARDLLNQFPRYFTAAQIISELSVKLILTSKDMQFAKECYNIVWPYRILDPMDARIFHSALGLPASQAEGSKMLPVCLSLILSVPRFHLGNLRQLMTLRKLHADRLKQR